MDVGRRFFIACYAASGAAALVYQVVWIRLFALVLGHTVAASSTVLAAFMGGLALGAWAAGRFQPSPSRRLHAYAILEIFIALVAMALPLILSEFQPLLRWAYADGNAPVLFTYVRVAISLALVGLPAAAMGATFPIAVSWLANLGDRRIADSRLKSSLESGLLYAANTAGAAIGALGAGFWLIPAIGLRGTTWLGVALNVAAALGALWLARFERKQNGTGLGIGDLGFVQRKSRIPNPKSRIPTIPRPALACTAASLSGFSALVYEVTWTRLLALVIGPTTYAFATMAASFVTGIALGSLIGVRLARRFSQPALWLAAMLITTAVSTLAAAWFAASRLPLLVARRVSTVNSDFESVLLWEAVAVVLLLLPASLALGATFTLALATASSGIAAVARDTARVYVANTIGAVLGALAAGFILVPRLGLEATFIYTSRLAAIGGVVLAATTLVRQAKGTQKQRGFAASLAIAVLLAVMISVPGWDRDLLASGAYKYAREMSTEELEANLRAGHLEYYKEGVAGTVSVRRLGGFRALAIDGKVDASNAGDMLTQRLLGILPVLLHPNPRDTLVIGLGSGVTVGSMLASGEVRHADVVEISPEVVEASAFFASENGRALQAPAVRLLIADGRSHLLLTTRQYDVIVSEPSNPWMAGIAALFTREFFESARARLKPDGVFCQWAHTYEIAASDLKSIVRTFASVFPQGTMWLVGDADLLLIGTTDIESGLARIAERWRVGSIPAALEDVAVRPPAVPFVLLSLFAGGPNELASYGDGAPIQIDDKMALEFTAARALYERPPSNAPAIRALSTNARHPDVVATALKAADATSWTARGTAALKAAAFEMAYESFQRAVALDSRAVDALRGMSEAAAGANRIAEEVKWLQTLAAAEPTNTAVQVELSHVLAASGDLDAAMNAATDASRLDSNDPRPLEQLASIFADSGNVERLGPLADTLVARFPDRDDSRYYHATAMFLRGRLSEAAGEARSLLNKNPRYARAQTLLGAVCATAGQLECARSAFEAAIHLTPRDPAPYVNLGSLRLQAGQPTLALDWFSEALAIDPTSVAARDGLAQTRAALALSPP